MNKVLGNYVEIDSDLEEYLDIGISMSSNSAESDWQKNSMCAEFIASYMANVISKHKPNTDSESKNVNGAINYIANELFENAVKFSFSVTNKTIFFRAQLDDNVIRFYVGNSIDESSVTAFQDVIEQLLSEDPDALYMKRLAGRVEETSNAGSGLGYLSMMVDYDAKIAWKFEPMPNSANAVFVTTMIKIGV